ncbi:hypothetical protein H4S07_001383 [Coemansia furcata]|uniref:Uncharacterized protein n=1 Tax=Coemansia furcata TaxID=417177 RepID=A0ACC1LMJ6_9FUNG|nr:hypothetical protein H4S07_001383 [Coemansia furcata]
MPDIPDEKPARGRGTGLPRGRGRGRGASAAAPAAGALPSERLSSIRNDPSTATPGPSAPKTRFAPTIPVRRNKKEPSALLADKKPEVRREFNSKFERGRGRGSARGGRGQHDLVQTVAGPFAQGPASLGNSSARRTMGSVFIGGGSSSAGGISSGGGGLIGSAGKIMKQGASLPGITSGSGSVGNDAKMDVSAYGDISSGDRQPFVLVTDHNETSVADELAVQTEEMAIAAAESMNRLSLDTSMGELFTRPATTAEEDYDDERLVVFQFPGIPEFELSEATIEARKQKSAMQRDVKPNISELDAAQELVAMAADIKPDLTALTIEDDKEEEAATESNAEEDSAVEGRIGTLVVLKSGAVKMKIGDILLDISRGADCEFFRGLLALDGGEQGENNHSAFLLGNVDAVAMCTPDLESIL